MLAHLQIHGEWLEKSSVKMYMYVILLLGSSLTSWHSVNALASHHCDPVSIPGVGM